MAEIIGNEGGGGKHQKKRAKKGHVHIDMTPMVDLAFLLLTFFILATTLSKPKTMEIVYPKEKDIEDSTKVQEKLATTILLGEEEEDIYYYFGAFKADSTVPIKSDLSKDGLRKVFIERNREIIEKLNAEMQRLASGAIKEDEFKSLRKAIKGDSLAPFVVVKTVDSTYYGSVVDVIDDLNIAEVGKYAIQDMSETEEIALKQAKAAEK